MSHFATESTPAPQAAGELGAQQLLARLKAQTGGIPSAPKDDGSLL